MQGGTDRLITSFNNILAIFIIDNSTDESELMEALKYDFILFELHKLTHMKRTKERRQMK